MQYLAVAKIKNVKKKFVPSFIIRKNLYAIFFKF